MEHANRAWSEADSQTFIDYGRYFVPDRETQIETLCALIPPPDEQFHVLELCCGEGLLAGALLERFPTAVVHGYDGSPEMLRQARDNLAHFGDRFDTQRFDLASPEWRTPSRSLHAVVSSLAIHHLDGTVKRELFRDVCTLLEPGGVFLIADIVRPATPEGVQVAAEAWDDAVRRRAFELDGSADAFELFRRERWNHYRYPDPTDKPSRLFDQLQWLADAGFADVDVFWMRAGHAIFGGRRP